MIAGDRRRDCERGGNQDTKDPMPDGGESDLTEDKCQRAGRDPADEPAKRAGAAMKRRHAGSEANKKRQRVDREGKDQPAKQADTE